MKSFRILGRKCTPVSCFVKLSESDSHLFSQMIDDIRELLKQHGAFDDDIQFEDRKQQSAAIKEINRIYRDYKRKKRGKSG